MRAGSDGLLVSAMGAASLLASTLTATARGDTPAVCPPACPAPPRSPAISPRAKGRWWPGFAMRALSLRGSVERSQVGRDDRNAGSVGLEERALAYMTLGHWSARYSDLLSFGGGDAGVDTGLALDAAIGYRTLFAKDHGPVARLGLRAHWLERGLFRTTLVELPQAQLGYGYLTRTVHVEAAARAGPVLTGRYAVRGAASARLDESFEGGLYVAIGLKPIRFDVEATRYRFGSRDEPVDTIDALLCGALGRPTVCFQTIVTRGTLGVGTTLETATSSYVGLSLGLGAAEWR